MPLKTVSLRTIITQKIKQTDILKSQLLAWSQQFREVVFLDSNDHKNRPSQRF
jgi:para-aminobenzoate synthetase component 1